MSERCITVIRTLYSITVFRTLLPCANAALSGNEYAKTAESADFSSLSLSLSISFVRSFACARALSSHSLSRALSSHSLSRALSHLSAPVKETLSRARLIGGSDARMKCRVRKLQSHLLLHGVN